MRRPAVAGSFYAADRQGLVKQIESCYLHKLGPGNLPKYIRERCDGKALAFPSNVRNATAFRSSERICEELPMAIPKHKEKGARKIKGAVVPHAGYMYSGPVAAWVYSALAEDGFPECFVIIGPNHTGYGSGIALTKEPFSTPLGTAGTDETFADALLNTIIDNDSSAHKHEHSIEVQLPFLQYIKEDICFVPLCMGIQDYQTAKDVGNAIKNAVSKTKRDIVVIASSDFTHYETRAEAERKDKIAIKEILNLNSKALYEAVERYSITMCGYGPVMAMLESITGTKGTLLKYATSGDIEKQMSEVVGYAGIIIE